VVLALFEILCGAHFLFWAFTRGVYDESSLGTVFFLWGSLGALFGLVIPGLLLLVRHPIRWALQPLAALVSLWMVPWFFASLVRLVTELR
jgi:hypothetical protein